MALVRLLALCSLVMISLVIVPGCGFSTAVPPPPPEVGKVPDEMAPPVIDFGTTLEPIDKTRIPTLANIDPAYAVTALDPQMTYGVPYMVTFTGIAYNKEVVGEIEPSWSVLEKRTDLKGRITILDDMRETIGAALKYKGYSCNTTNEAELAEARGERP